MDYSMLLVIEYLDRPLGLNQAGSGVKVRSSNSQSSQADFLTVYKSEFKSAYQSSTSSVISKKEVRRGRFSELSRNVFISEDRKLVYHIGIIDYLQEWNNTKRIEAFYKTYMLFRKGKLISAVPPNPFKKRFNKDIINSVLRSNIKVDEN